MPKSRYNRGKDGYFKTCVWTGEYDLNGKKKTMSLRTAKSSKDLERMVNEHNQKLKDGLLVKSSSMTFYQYAVHFVDVYKANRSKNTLAMYRNIVEKHLYTLEVVPLSDISRIHYISIINNAGGKGRTQQQINMIFKQIIKSAIADKYLPASRFNDIFENVDKVKYVPSKKESFALIRKEDVITADLRQMDKSFLYIIYGCGLRRGECLALTINDFDLKARNLTVNKALAFEGNNPYLKEPKSHNGYRTVHIPSSVFSAIRDYIYSLKLARKENLFTSKDGGLITKSGYVRMWSRIQTALGTTELTAHAFRHNFCTNLCYQIPRISTKKIAELLGDTEKMVIDVYSHILAEKEDADGAIEDAMNL